MQNIIKSGSRLWCDSQKWCLYLRWLRPNQIAVKKIHASAWPNHTMATSVASGIVVIMVGWESTISINVVEFLSAVNDPGWTTPLSTCWSLRATIPSSNFSSWGPRASVSSLLPMFCSSKKSSFVRSNFQTILQYRRTEQGLVFQTHPFPHHDKREHANKEKSANNIRHWAEGCYSVLDFIGGSSFRDARTTEASIIIVAAVVIIVVIIAFRVAASDRAATARAAAVSALILVIVVWCETTSVIATSIYTCIKGTVVRRTLVVVAQARGVRSRPTFWWTTKRTWMIANMKFVCETIADTQC